MSLGFPSRWRTHRHPVNVRHVGVGRTFGERLADGLTAAVGSWPFIVTQSLLLAAWIVANGILIRGWLGDRPFDPYRSSYSTSCSRSRPRTRVRS